MMVRWIVHLPLVVFDEAKHALWISLIHYDQLV